MSTKNLEELNKWASKLSLKEIQNLSESEILSVVMERPGHLGQYGFMLGLSHFKSQEHFAETMHALMERLNKIDNLKEKMKNTEQPQQKIKEGNNDISIIKEIARPFWVDKISENPPKFVILMGGTGVGKTTIRKQKYSDYINFDFGEISLEVKNILGENNPELTKYTVLTCALLLEIGIESKRNIVIEIIGDNKDLIVPVKEEMEKIGYSVSMVYIHAEPAQAIKRHIEALNNSDYLPALNTQKNTLHFFYQKFKIDEIPNESE
jgi:hypothetical protein